MKAQIIRKEDYGVTKLYFNPNAFFLDLEDFEKELLSHKLVAKITGYDIDRLAYGEVILYYNPVVTEEKWHEECIEDMEKYINNHHFSICGAPE